MSSSTGGGTGQGGPSMSGGNEIQADAMVVNSRLIMPPGSFAGFGVEDPEYAIEMDGMMKFHNQGTLPNSKSLALYCTNGNELYWQNQLLTSGSGTHATDITITDKDSDADYFPAFVSTSGTQQNVYIQNGDLAGTKAFLKYTISSSGTIGTLATTKFEGDLTGNVTGDVTGDLTGNVTGIISTNPLTISSISKSSATVAQVTTTTDHNLSTGDGVTVAGIDQVEYNRTSAITKISDTVFTYTHRTTTTNPTFTSATATPTPVDGNVLGAATSIANYSPIQTGSTTRYFPVLQSTASNTYYPTSFHSSNTGYLEWYYKDGTDPTLKVHNVEIPSPGVLTGNVTGDLTGNVTATSVLANGVTATTQATSDDSTKVATTEFAKNVATDEGRRILATDSVGTETVTPAEGYNVYEINNLLGDKLVTLEMPGSTTNANGKRYYITAYAAYTGQSAKIRFSLGSGASFSSILTSSQALYSPYPNVGAIRPGEASDYEEIRNTAGITFFWEFVAVYINSNYYYMFNRAGSPFQRLRELRITDESNGNATVIDSTGITGGINKVKTVASSTNATYYLTFVDSNNGTATEESVYTNSQLLCNPSTGSITAEVLTAVGNSFASKLVGGPATNLNDPPAYSERLVLQSSDNNETYHQMRTKSTTSAYKQIGFNWYMGNSSTTNYFSPLWADGTNTYIGGCWNNATPIKVPHANTHIEFSKNIEITSSSGKLYVGNTFGTTEPTTGSFYITYAMGSANWAGTSSGVVINTSGTGWSGTTTSIWARYGVLSGLNFTLTSDERNKRRIRSLKPADSYEVVKKLRPVTFLWKDAMKNRTDGLHSYGFIAQDIEKVVPQTVSSRPGIISFDRPIMGKFQVCDISNIVTIEAVEWPVGEFNIPGNGVEYEKIKIGDIIDAELELEDNGNAEQMRFKVIQVTGKYINATTTTSIDNDKYTGSVALLGRENEAVKDVEQTQLIALLVSALQASISKVETLEDRLSSLESMIIKRK